jgi:competence ComEA-like helix-hairpin-helix protein
MQVSDGQRLGAVIVLIASLFVYLGTLLHERHPFPVSALSWGDQGPGMIAVELTGKQGVEGIYFFPEATAFTELQRITGQEAPGENSGFLQAWRSADPALSVSVAGGTLKIADMPSVTRLALGLPVDINRATEEEFTLVPGIGESLAYQIVQLRNLRGEFERLEDLKAVPGIKEKKLQNLEKYLFVKPAPSR